MPNQTTHSPSPVLWNFAGRQLALGPPPAALPLFMGIVNTTPDSFSDGGLYADPAAAVDHALRLIDEGADIIDVGGESTRPGSDPVDLETELARTLPAIELLRRRSSVLISIDTSKAEVARRALEAGAQIINDVTALGGDPAMIDVARATPASGGGPAGLVVMHMAGTPKTMQAAPAYQDVVAEVRTFLGGRLTWLESHGVPRERVVLDPGIGFGKGLRHNLELVRGLASLGTLGRPICLGPSRKQFLGKLLDRPALERVHGTAAVSVAAYLRGAHILRVHDVRAVRDAVVMTRAVECPEER